MRGSHNLAKADSLFGQEMRATSGNSDGKVLMGMEKSNY